MPPIFPTQVVRDDSLRWINFFNGRLLTGDDLTQEQAANRNARLRLGQALGDGIAWGLWVAANGSAEVAVSAGEAVNREGQVLYLGQPQGVSLSLPPKGQGASNVGWFNACGSSQPVGDTGVSGLYLLTLGPAEGAEGLAPTSGLSGGVAACNSRYRTEAVQFKLILVRALAFDAKLRNAAAYDCLGLDSVNASLETPFGVHPTTYGRLDGLRPHPLTDDDVPLALIFRDSSGIRFVDNWSVRRRVRLNAKLPYQPWHFFLSDRRTSEGEAAFFQFQEQLADLFRFEAGEITKSNFYAGARFKYLPPAGLLPASVNWRSFLGLHAPVQETQIDLGLLDQFLLTALQRQPITLTTPPYTAVDIYQVPDLDFVLFCRSDLGRLQVNFSPPPQALVVTAINIDAKVNGAAGPSASAVSLEEGSPPASPSAPAQPTPAPLTIHSTESNLAVNAWARTSGEIVSPNLLPGAYRVNGSLGGLVFSRKKVNIVGSQITLITVPMAELTPENMYLDVGWLGGAGAPTPVRLCLVAGTFADAVTQSYAETNPWQQPNMINLQERIVPLGQAQQDRLREWHTLFKQRFPALDVGSFEDTQLLVDNKYNFPDPANVSSLPEVPQVYAVFGKFGVPLTIIPANNASPTPWSAAEAPFNKDADLMAALLRYEIPYFDQIAGAWVQMIVEATGLASKDARKLIIRAIKKMQQQ